MKAIIYQSKTGYTKKYALALSEKTGIPAYEWKKETKNVSDGASVIYLTWNFASQVKDLKKVKERFNVKAVGVVGMNVEVDKAIGEIKKNAELGDSKLYFLLGGFCYEKLTGIHKMMISMLRKSLKSKVEKGENVTDNDKGMVDAMYHGCDFYDEKYLDGLLDAAKEM